MSDLIVVEHVGKRYQTTSGPVEALHRFVPEGSLVIDVGANIGFFTTRFADWVGGRGHVVAIEPDLDCHGSSMRFSQARA